MSSGIKMYSSSFRLTNRDINDIRKKMGLGQGSSGSDDWWNGMWGQQTK